MSYYVLILTRSRSRYDAMSDIDQLTTKWAHGDPDCMFSWAPFERNGALTREQLIEASVRPGIELTEKMLGYADHIIAYNETGRLAKHSRGNPSFAPSIPPLPRLVEMYHPTWVASMIVRWFDSQDEPISPVNRYVFLRPGEKLFVIHKSVSSHAKFEYVVGECAVNDADDGLEVKWVAGLETNEVCNLTAEGNSLLDGFRESNEARLKREAEQNRPSEPAGAE
jgi:hypothetical protein